MQRETDRQRDRRQRDIRQRSRLTETGRRRVTERETEKQREKIRNRASYRKGDGRGVEGTVYRRC